MHRKKLKPVRANDKAGKHKKQVHHQITVAKKAMMSQWVKFAKNRLEFGFIGDAG